MSAAWTPPEIFDEYRVLRPIGRGGMGQVFLGHDTFLDRPVAVKFIAAQRPDAAVQQRFLLEARAIARLQHPGVVAIHRIGEVEGRQYIISELIKGQSLSQIEKPLPGERVLRIGIALSQALAAVHRQGILHRDIKPGNVMLTLEGEVKLLDFGLAKLVGSAEEEIPASFAGGDGGTGPLTQAGAVVGTPLYMAPEVAAGEPAQKSSDVYSLGAVLYELCSGRAPGLGSGTSEEGLVTTALSGEFETHAAGAAPLVEAAPGIDPRFASVVDRCLRPSPADRFDSGDELRDALEQLQPDTRPLPVPAGDPYPGLQPFEAEQRALFFGRAREVRAILDRLRGEPLLLVTGDSGVGKSSLCRAGVLPLVAEGHLDDGRSYTIVRLVPGRRPLTALLAVLAPLLALTEEVLSAMVRADPGALGRALRHRRGGTLLFLDQMEELLTLSDPAEAAGLGEVLGELSLQAPGVRVLMTVRGDFLTRLALLPGLGDEITHALYILRPLGAEAMREAIVGPARIQGVAFESEALIGALLSSASTTAGGLPVLQFALSELWQARDVGRQVIPAVALAAIGGVVGALQRHADGVLSSLLPAQREEARRMLLRLVNLDGTRARHGEEELLAQGPGARAALEALVRGRLLVARQVDGAPAYELAHEAMLAGWTTLREWIEAAGERRSVVGRIAAAAAEWERLGRTREALWSERQLGEVARLGRLDLSPRESSFVRASRRALRRRRLLGGAALLSLPLVIGLAYGGYRLKVRRDLDRAIAAHSARARVALAEARGRSARVEDEERRALLLFDLPEADRAEAERLHAVALQLDRRAEDAYQGASQALEAALLLDGSRPELRLLLGQVTYEQILRAERLHHGQKRAELLRHLRNYDADGALYRMLSLPGSLSLRSAPAAARVSLSRFDDDEERRRLVPVGELGRTPLGPLSLPPGSYLLLVEAPGRAPVRLPLLLARGEQLSLDLALPPAGAVPAGYVYVPPGRFLFGSSGDEDLRRGFLGAPPLHEVRTGPYLIGRTEVTFGEWLEFLRALPPAERALRLPKTRSFHGALELRELPDGAFELMLQPTLHAYRARPGEPLRYKDRAVRAVQDWQRLPVSAVSWNDAQAYARWLTASGRLPGARLCDEWEWERGARGADDRRFPHGDRLLPEDANFDATYGRRPGAFGPDEVGAHPASESPFGLQDMAGNVWEWTRSVRRPDEAAIRGGAFYQDALNSRSNNRDPTEPSQRNILIGVRVCATLGPGG